MATAQLCGAYGSVSEADRAPQTGQVTYSSPAGRGLLAAVALGGAMLFLDTTAVNVALPTIGTDLDASVSQLQWVVTGYTLTLGAFLLLGGSMGDRVGRRRMYLVGVALFPAASLLCALAPGIEWLIAARIAQGLAGAVLTPGSLAIIEASFVREDRGRAIGRWAGFTGLAAALGPPLGGRLAEIDWRLVFVVNLPVAAGAFVMTRRHVPESSEVEPSGPLDWRGAIMIALALGSLTVGLVSWSGDGRGIGVMAVSLAVALVAALGFASRERHAADPMVPAILTTNRTFTLANAITFACYAAHASFMFFLVLQLQTTLGFRPLLAGLAVLPFPIMLFLLSARAGRFAGTRGPRPLLLAGPLVAAAGALWLALLREGDTYLHVLPGILLVGIGFGLHVAPLTATVLAAAPDHLASIDSGVNNAVSYTGGLLGVASLPAVVGVSAQDYTDPAALTPGYQSAMLLCALALVVGSLLATRIPRQLGQCRIVPA